MTTRSRWDSPPPGRIATSSHAAGLKSCEKTSIDCISVQTARWSLDVARARTSRYCSRSPVRGPCWDLTYRKSPSRWRADPSTRRAVSFARPSEYQPDARIDLAFCNGVFHHVDPAMRPSAAKYVSDCLRPGGIFALWENNPWNPGTRYVMSRIPFDKDAITLTASQGRRLLEEAGFRVLSIEYSFIFPHALRWLRSLEAPLSKLPIGGQYQLLAMKQ